MTNLSDEPVMCFGNFYGQMIFSNFSPCSGDDIKKVVL